MNLDDESHLSAYLDDELDSADRRAVERSIEASPPLADRLRSIAQARDAVAGLDRPPVPRDLAPVLRARIASNRQEARRLRARVVVAVSGFAGFAAIAASLIFAMIRLNQSLHESPEPIQVAQNEPSPAPDRPHSIPDSDPISPAPALRPVPTVIDAPSPPPVPVREVPAAVAAPADPDPDPRRLVGDILGRSHVRRIVIVTDLIEAPDRVQDLIARNGREAPEFGRISIRQAIDVDAEHAEPAEVFAVPIDERGRRSFVSQLQKAFPQLIEEGRSRPELVAGLTRVGQVAVFRGLKAAPLGDPPTDLPGFIARREKEGAPFVDEDHRPTAPVPPRDPADRPAHFARADGAAEGDPDDLDSEFVGPPDLERKAPPRPGERVTLLVWVTRPGRR